jgi:hypothetical protein
LRNNGGHQKANSHTTEMVVKRTANSQVTRDAFNTESQAHHYDRAQEVPPPAKPQYFPASRPRSYRAVAERLRLSPQRPSKPSHLARFVQIHAHSIQLTDAPP